MLSSVVVTHLVAMATDAGVEPLRASRLLAIMATVAAFGKIVFGRLADRAGVQTAYAVSIVLEMIAIGGILLLPTSLALEGITAVLGLGIGGNLPLSAALIARTFGPTAFGPMMGMKTMLMTPLVATGTPSRAGSSTRRAAIGSPSPSSSASCCCRSGRSGVCGRRHSSPEVARRIRRDRMRKSWTQLHRVSSPVLGQIDFVEIDPASKGGEQEDQAAFSVLPPG